MKTIVFYRTIFNGVFVEFENWEEVLSWCKDKELPFEFEQVFKVVAA